MGDAEGEAAIGEAAGRGQPQRIAPVERGAPAAIGVAGAVAAELVGQVGVAAAVLGRGHTEPGGPGAVEQLRLAAELAGDAAVLGAVVRVVLRDVVEPEVVLPPAQQALDPRAFDRRPAEPRGRGRAAEAVAFRDVGLEARRHGVEAARRDRIARKQVVHGADRAGRPGAPAQRVLAAAGELAIGLEDAVGGRPPRHQVDHAADRAGPVQRRGRAAQHLDPLHVEQQVVAEVEGAVRVGGIVHRHAVQQHQHVAAGIAADEAAGLAAEPAGRGEAEARDRGQRLGQRLVAAFLDILAGEDGDGGRHAVLRRRDAGAGDDGVGDGGLGMRSRGKDGEAACQDQGGASHRFPPCGQDERAPAGRHRPGRRASFPQTEEGRQGPA